MLQFLYSFVLVSAVFSEPQCSRFHYEEQTLMKMLRLEMAIEKLQMDMATTQKEVLDTLQKMREETQQLKDDWSNEKEDIRQYRKDVNRTITENIMEYTNELENLKGPAVAFQSKDVTDMTPSSGNTLVFKTTLLNEGDGYDSESGIFTAPRGGTYMFTVQFCVRGGNNMYYAIVVDNAEIKKGWFCDQNWTTCYTADTLAVLKPGAEVKVKVTSGTSELPQHSQYWNTFSGVLLHY